MADIKIAITTKTSFIEILEDIHNQADIANTYEVDWNKMRDRIKYYQDLITNNKIEILDRRK